MLKDSDTKQSSRKAPGGEKVKEYWETMSPNHRRISVIVLAVSGLFLFMSFVTGGDENLKLSKTKAVERNVLTDSNTRTIGIDALNAKVKSVDTQNDRIKKELERMKVELVEMKRRKGNDPDMTRELTLLKGQMKTLTDKAKTIGWEVADIKEGYYQVPGSTNTVLTQSSIQSGNNNKDKNKTRFITQDDFINDEPQKKRTINVEEGLNTDPNFYFRTAPQRSNSPAPVAGAPSLKNGALPGGGLQIFTAESVSQEISDEEEGEVVYLPSGTIVSGVLLNGLDAPTGRAAKKDPFPVLVRIQKDAVMPNLHNADIKECFATLSGYGELSAERAYLRGEKFSCITNDGGVIEEDFPAYGVGEDGKAGIRGRLVTKAGSLLAKTALAGFAAGVADAFGSSPVPVIQTGTPGSTSVFQDNYSTDAIKHGVSVGASAALGRLADYYMDMADSIFPVIEVDASRQIDIVLTSGFSLTVKPAKNMKLAKRK